MVLKSTEEEAADCRAAFAGSAVGDLALHVHHEMLYEPLTEPAEARIICILEKKNESEQALRLRLFRPLKTSSIAKWEVIAALKKAEWDKALIEWDKARIEWSRANAKWDKTNAEREKALIEWEKARIKWDEALIEWDKTHIKFHEALAEWRKANAEWYKANAKKDKASAEWHKTLIELNTAKHKENCQPGCPWDGKTIFP